MSNEDDSPEERMAFAAKQLVQSDPLTFTLRGAEIRDILLDQARVAEKMAKDEAKPVRGPRPLPMTPPPQVAGLHGHGPMPIGQYEAPSMREPYLPIGQYEAPSMREPYLRAARHYRFLASHVEEKRVFRLGVHDLAFLGIPASNGGILPEMSHLAAVQAIGDNRED